MTVVLEIPPEKEAALQAQARARGLTVQQWLLTLAEQSGAAFVDSGCGSDAPPIWEIILDEVKDVQPEDMAVLPKDGASQIDHYVYGLPKRDQ